MTDKFYSWGVQAFDEGPWPRMSGRQRGNIMNKLAALMEVGYVA